MVPRRRTPAPSSPFLTRARCQWNGPLALFDGRHADRHGNLRQRQQDVVDRQDYLDLLRSTNSHRLKRDDGTIVPWIDENLNPLTGDWIARTRLKTFTNGTWDARKGGRERGKDYNHSTYCDLVITGLVGLRPRADDTVEVNPLVPAEAWDYFCLDQIRYHGRWLTILYDKTGRRYGKGAGLRVFADGREIARSDSLARVSGPLPPSTADPTIMPPPTGPSTRRTLCLAATWVRVST